MPEQTEQTENFPKETKTLPPLPFNYKKTDDLEKATYKIPRKKLIVWGKENPFKTDEEILKEVVKEREKTDWFIDKKWREKGQPEEQIEFEINGEKITIYNFCKEKQITDKQVELTQKALREISSKFPQILDKVKYILINDKPTVSAWGDEEKFPCNGTFSGDWKAVILYPRTLDPINHRIKGATNLDGTIVHEIGHSISSDFDAEWKKAGLEYVMTLDNEDWETFKSPDGTKNWYRNKKTGRVAFSHGCMADLDQCVTEYGSINQHEDICECIVACIFNPELLKKISPKKFEILQSHDVNQPLPEVRAKRIPKDQIRLPEIKPETIHYYIQEPKTV